MRSESDCGGASTSTENPNPWLTIVGVIADVADGPPGVEPSIHAYEPFSQFPDVMLNNVPTSFGRQIKLAVRTEADPRALASAVRAEIGAIDPHLAIESIATMDDRVGDVVAPRRFSAMTLGAFAMGSLLLAAIGLYGLLAFNVSERRPRDRRPAGVGRRAGGRSFGW